MSNDNLELIETTPSSDKILVVGYPKSGNTWLGYMLSYAVGGKYIDLRFPNTPPTQQEDVQQLIGWHDFSKHHSHYKYVCKTHDRYAREPDFGDYDKKILIIRDPRDVAISLHFFLLYNSKSFHGVKISEYGKLQQKLHLKKVILSVLVGWKRHFNSWKSKNVYVIRYEELNVAPQKNLHRMLEHLGITTSPDFLDDVTTQFSFEKLSKGRHKGEVDKTAFFRKGIVGDYVNYFDNFDNLLFQVFYSNILRTLTYEI